MRVEKRKVARTGNAPLGWYLGRGYVQERLTVTSEVWCVVDESGILAECRSKKKADMIADALVKSTKTSS